MGSIGDDPYSAARCVLARPVPSIDSHFDVNATGCFQSAGLDSGYRSKRVDGDDGLGKVLRRFLRQIVSDATTDDPECMFAKGWRSPGLVSGVCFSNYSCSLATMRVIQLAVVVPAVDLVSDNGEVRLRRFEWVRLPRKADRRNFNLSLQLA